VRFIMTLPLSLRRPGGPREGAFSTVLPSPIICLCLTEYISSLTCPERKSFETLSEQLLYSGVRVSFFSLRRQGGPGRRREENSKASGGEDETVPICWRIETPFGNMHRL
jgi:hypothetical protein